MTTVDVHAVVSVPLLPCTSRNAVPFMLGRKYTIAECASYTAGGSSASGHEYEGRECAGRIQMSRMAVREHEVPAEQHVPQVSSVLSPDDAGSSVAVLQE
eukprot:COSAG02_NODE_7145_length_3158_cov_1.728016_1_plen_100_part_00